MRWWHQRWRILTFNVTQQFLPWVATSRTTTLSYKGVTFVGWYFDGTFLYKLFLLMVCVLLYVISLHYVVCLHIVLILIEHWYGTMNRLRTGWTEVWILVGARNFSLSQSAQTSYEATQPCIQWIPVYSLAIELLGHEVNHSLPPTAEDTNDWSYTSNSPVCLYVWILVVIF